jgi:hypothetical protein
VLHDQPDRELLEPPAVMRLKIAHGCTGGTT